MKIKQITEIDEIDILNIFEKDSNGREINVYKLSNAMITGESLYYPNTLLYDGVLYNPVNETTMSLKNVKIDNYFDFKLKKITKTEENSVFFFIYNMDNYFHFIYDSLPYLISFNKLKETNSEIKLLMNYPAGKNVFYKFVLEFLDILGLKQDDIIIADENTNYKNIFVSTSYTHDFDSNLPPRNEIYDFYQQIIDNIKTDNTDLPKKIYISRRSWLHGDMSNIGTNYTTRRKLVNEDELVKFLVGKGYKEIFTETFTTEEKIAIFKNAESVVGAIGGGLCNVLFSNNNCELIALVSPNFLEINERFKFSFKNVKTILFDKVEPFETGEFKTYMRVKVGDIVGEIIEIKGDNIKIAYSDTKIAGWNNNVTFNSKTVKAHECVKLDDGLNSSWVIDLDEVKKLQL